MKRISIAKDFSRTPGGRTSADGDDNGEKFRNTFLEPVIREADELEIDIDGVAGLPGSFCDAAFGGVIRRYKLDRAQFERHFHIVGCSDEYLINKKNVDINVERALDDVANGVEV